MPETVVPPEIAVSVHVPSSTTMDGRTVAAKRPEASDPHEVNEGVTEMRPSEASSDGAGAGESWGPFASSVGAEEGAGFVGVAEGRADPPGSEELGRREDCVARGTEGSAVPGFRDTQAAAAMPAATTTTAATAMAMVTPLRPDILDIVSTLT